MTVHLRRFFAYSAVLALLLASWGSTALAQRVAATAVPQQAGSAVAAPGPPATGTASIPAAVGRQPHGYKVSPGDTLDITVYDAPDLSEKTVVTDRGQVYMPLVKTVDVGGMNLEQAQTQIENALQKGGFLNAPLVRIVVADYARGVDVMGEVAKPGTYPVAGSKRLFELITLAGGPTTTAGPIVTIRRWPDEHQENVPLSNDSGQLLNSDVWVNQGDSVIVSKAGVVYVVGEVLQPSGFVMSDRTDYTVLKVVAMAHGTTKLAKLSRVKIVRKSSTGLKEIPVPLDKILASRSPDIALLPDDIVFVPTSGAKNAAQKSGEVALSLIAGVGVVAATRF